jgi:2-methylcitrate dehydratase PrpD
MTIQAKTAEFPQIENLTRDVARFVVGTNYDDLPEAVIEAGRKSILDGIGLALAGSVAHSGGSCQRHRHAACHRATLRRLCQRCWHPRRRLR